MRHAVTLARQEVRGGWRRNVVKGAILVGAIGTQLFTSLAAAASQEAVTAYGAAVFGYEQTFRADLEQPPSLVQLEAMDASLDGQARAHPSVVVVVQAGVTAGLTSATAPIGGPQTTASLSSYHGRWGEVSATSARSWTFAEVGGRQALPRLVLSGPLGDRLGASPTTLVTVTVTGRPVAPPTDGEADGREADGAADGWAQTSFSVPGVPAHRGPVETNKALVNDVVASRSLLRLMGAAPESASIYWRCAGVDCTDAAGVARDIARAAGLRLGEGYRVDTHDSLVPVLRQQREQGALFAWVALGLGALAVAVVATAMVEVRTPELVTLRTLGATRSALFAAALLEGVVVAVAVALLVVAASLALARLDPDLLNHIDAVHLDHFSPPLEIYLRTGLTTLLVGLLTGLLPALRAYRLVRAH